MAYLKSLSTTPEPRPTGGSAHVLGFSPHRKNTLLGFASVHFPRLRLKMLDVAVHRKGRARWAQLPARPVVTREGELKRDPATGKIAYAAILEFDSTAVREAFSHAVCEALEAYQPGIFDAAEEE